MHPGKKTTVAVGLADFIC